MIEYNNYPKPIIGMDREKAWVWFKGGLQGGGYWLGGFLASKSPEGGYIVEKSDFVKCRLPEWRVNLKEPKSKDSSPNIPVDAIWKYL